MVDDLRAFVATKLVLVVIDVEMDIKQVRRRKAKGQHQDHQYYFSQ